MSLIVANLKNELIGMTDSFAATPIEAGQRMADAYTLYAMDALSCGGGAPLPASVESASVVLATALGGVFASSLDPGTTANGLASAFTAFWFSPPMAFSSIPPAGPGVVTVVGGTAALAAALAALAPTTDANAAITNVANALDAFTKTVIVTHPVPPGAPCVVPIF